jgi:hypothetical protein
MTTTRSSRSSTIEQLYHSVPPRSAGAAIATACGKRRKSVDCDAGVSAMAFVTASLTVSSSHFAPDDDCNEIKG